MLCLLQATNTQTSDMQTNTQQAQCKYTLPPHTTTHAHTTKQGQPPRKTTAVAYRSYRHIWPVSNEKSMATFAALSICAPMLQLEWLCNLMALQKPPCVIALISAANPRPQARSCCKARCVVALACTSAVASHLQYMCSPAVRILAFESRAQCHIE